MVVEELNRHPVQYLPRPIADHVHRLNVTQNYSAVTAACMVLRREVFDEVGGLEEVNLPIAFNDSGKLTLGLRRDFCSPAAF